MTAPLDTVMGEPSFSFFATPPRTQCGIPGVHTLIYSGIAKAQLCSARHGFGATRQQRYTVVARNVGGAKIRRLNTAAARHGVEIRTMQWSGMVAVGHGG